MTHITRPLLLASLLAIGAGGMHAQDGYLTNLALPRYVKAATNYPISVHVKNAAGSPIPSFTIRWRVDGGAWNNGNTVNITLPGLPVGNAYMPHTHPVQLNVAAGPHTLELQLTVAGDPNPANNTLSMSFVALATWADKVALLEGRTETWCPNCPNANNVTTQLMANPDYAVAKFHLSDALDDCQECITYFNQNYSVNFTPASVLEMGEYGTYTPNSVSGAWNDQMAARAAGVSPVELELTSDLDWNSRLLTVTLDATFSHVVAGTHKLNVYVIEDNVPGPQSGASSGYIHQGVMRAMLGGASGTAGVVPASPVVGTTYGQTYTWTVPSGYTLGNLRLIGVLEHSQGPGERYCMNAVNSPASPVGIAERTPVSDLSVYPNPFHDVLQLTLAGTMGPVNVELRTLEGRTVLTREVHVDRSGTITLELGGLDLAPGAYVLQVGTATRRVMRGH